MRESSTSWCCANQLYFWVVSKWGGGGVWSETAWGGFLGGDDTRFIEIRCLASFGWLTWASSFLPFLIKFLD